MQFQQYIEASCHQVFFLQGKAPKEIHAILTETLACFLPGRAKDLLAPHVRYFWKSIQYQINVFDASFNSPPKLGADISTGYWKREMYD